MSRLHDVAAQGQAVWLDDLRRGLVSSGELQRMLIDDAVTGVTSNPTIFAKAICGSTDYDEQLRELVDAGATVEETYVTLIAEDIKSACDAFNETWLKSAGWHGFVSVEVSPEIAYDAEATIAEAREWTKRIDRENLLVKVPATEPGITAIEQLTAEGISINVTLIFSLERYRNVAEAYIKGLERFIAQGGDPRTVTSVASFFVSRVDVEVDSRLEELAAAAFDPKAVLGLKGGAGIANARAAYGIFLELLSGERWERVAKMGARVQRPLWASTSVKDPAYPDTMYVDALIAPNTVNTMPGATMRAFQDHGHPGAFGPAEIDRARELLDELGAVGIDYDDVTERVLVREGVEKFRASFHELFDCIGRKSEALRAGRALWSFTGVEIDAPPDLVTKVWTKDSSAWGEGEDDPADRLGWLSLPDVMEGRIDSLEKFARSVVDDGIDTVVLLGMGGSSLAPEMFARVFGAAPGHASLVALDSTHPDQIRAVREQLDLDRTLFLVTSKSGGTVETMSLYRYFRALKTDGGSFVAITDPGTSLEGLAEETDFRGVFVNRPDIGGRYSALSYFGLVPAALLGVDLRSLLSSALQMQHACEICVAPEDNPGLALGCAIATLAQRGRDKLTFVTSEPLASFGDWAEQLLAESTGKHGKGIVPIVGEPLVPAASYGQDRAFVHLCLEDDDSADGFLAEIEAAGHPLFTIRIPEPIDVGAEIFRWEFATAVAGSLLGINAFDQPDVEAAKRVGREILEAGDAPKWADDDPEGFFAAARPGDLAAILAFVPRTEYHAGVVATARRRLATAGIATMSGFGPRYLHSTGQLLKGGPTGVRALVVLDPACQDEAIPGDDAGFSRLIAAQALGDVRALVDAGKSVETTTWASFERWLEEDGSDSARR